MLITAVLAPLFAGIAWVRERIFQQRALAVREETEARRRVLEATVMRRSLFVTDVVTKAELAEEPRTHSAADTDQKPQSTPVDP
jgi:hypothetical protein